jgi:predicted transcriptional regulator
MEGIMFPSEMVILMAIAVARDPNEKLLTRPMDVTGEYIGYLCSSLVKRGFISENRPKGYQLTARGIKTVFEFLSRNKDKAEDAKKMLQQLGIEISQDMDKLEKEAIAVK